MKFPRKVYAITHNRTGRSYVGSSCDAVSRFHQHINDLRGRRHIVEDMQDDFDNYGEDYSFVMLDSINSWDERVKEYEWQKKYQSNVRGTGYNYQDAKWRAYELAAKRTKFHITFNGKTMSLSDWAREVGLPYPVLYERIRVRNWDIEKALTTPKGKRGGCQRNINADKPSYIT